MAVRKGTPTQGMHTLRRQSPPFASTQTSDFMTLAAWISGSALGVGSEAAPGSPQQPDKPHLTVATYTTDPYIGMDAAGTLVSGYATRGSAAVGLWHLSGTVHT